MANLYSEARDAGNAYRKTYLQQVQGLIARRRAESGAARAAFFAPDASSETAYAASVEPLRARFQAMLGYPLVDTPELPAVPGVKQSFVASDDLSEIHRLQIEAMPGYEMYGVLFLPPGNGPHRLVISQHGGHGTPELCSDFFGSGNYNDMTRRLLRQGFAVFAPQMLLWMDDFGPPLADQNSRINLDKQLKQLGGSITALELFGLQRSLDYLLGQPEFLSDAAGMCGLSYGGFYTLFAAANDPRIKAALSSCFVNDRFKHDWADWTWQNAAHQFLDAEVGGLVCPRALFIEIGETDELFEANAGWPVLQQIRGYYATLGLEDRYEGRIFGGGHELDTSEDGMDFLARHLA